MQDSEDKEIHMWISAVLNTEALLPLEKCYQFATLSLIKCVFTFALLKIGFPFKEVTLSLRKFHSFSILQGLYGRDF